MSNLGVRPLAFPIRKGGQKFEEVRWVQATFDAAPGALTSVGAAIQSEKGVLQFKHLRDRSYLGEFRPMGMKEKLKPFSAAMRFNADIFDPTSLTVGAPGSAEAIAATEAAAVRAREAAAGIAYNAAAAAAAAAAGVGSGGARPAATRPAAAAAAAAPLK